MCLVDIGAFLGTSTLIDAMIAHLGLGTDIPRDRSLAAQSQAVGAVSGVDLHGLHLGRLVDHGTAPGTHSVQGPVDGPTPDTVTIPITLGTAPPLNDVPSLDVVDAVLLFGADPTPGTVQILNAAQVLGTDLLGAALGLGTNSPQGCARLTGM